MARRGRCRCGQILRFRLGPWGYKKRCSQCGAIVRLRVRQSRGRRPAPALYKGTVKDFDVELYPVVIHQPKPLPRYFLWAAVAMGMVLIGIVAIIWFTRS